MSKITWDGAGDRIFETGVDHGVLYVRDNTGKYPKGVAWNGLVSVSESPSGAEATKIYADNIPYLTLRSAEEFGATIEAITYPDEFESCDGSASLVPGVTIGQQARDTFGLSYRTKVGNDIVGQDFGYKIHLIYGAGAAPTEKAYSTVNDSPETTNFSWELSTTPIEVPGYKNSATVVLDSTKLDADLLQDIEDILYGTDAVPARLPSPTELIALLGSAGSGARIMSAPVSEDDETDAQ